MRLVRNSGTDRGVDSLRVWLTPGASIDVLSPSFSLFAFAELRDALDRVGQCRLLLGEPDAKLLPPAEIDVDESVRVIASYRFERVVAFCVDVEHSRRGVRIPT
jgi:hypothetical protein